MQPVPVDGSVVLKCRDAKITKFEVMLLVIIENFFSVPGSTHSMGLGVVVCFRYNVNAVMHIHKDRQLLKGRQPREQSSTTLQTRFQYNQSRVHYKFRLHQKPKNQKKTRVAKKVGA